MTPRGLGPSAFVAGNMPPVPTMPTMPARYLSACLIVVEVHEAPGVLFNLASIYEASGKVDAVAHVG